MVFKRSVLFEEYFRATVWCMLIWEWGFLNIYFWINFHRIETCPSLFPKSLFEGLLKCLNFSSMHGNVSLVTINRIVFWRFENCVVIFFHQVWCNRYIVKLRYGRPRCRFSLCLPGDLGSVTHLWANLPHRIVVRLKQKRGVQCKTALSPHLGGKWGINEVNKSPSLLSGWKKHFLQVKQILWSTLKDYGKTMK